MIPDANVVVGAPVSAPSSVLLVHVAHVVGQRAKKQVVGIHAARHVAVMTDAHSFGNVASEKPPTCAVSGLYFRAAPPERTVSVMIDGTSKQPAS